MFPFLQKEINLHFFNYSSKNYITINFTFSNNSDNVGALCYAPIKVLAANCNISFLPHFEIVKNMLR